MLWNQGLNITQNNKVTDIKFPFFAYRVLTIDSTCSNQGLITIEILWQIHFAKTQQ